VSLSELSITKVNGIGKKSESLYHKLSIFSVDDLLNHFPFRYEQLEELTDLTKEYENNILIKGRVVSRGNAVFSRLNFFNFLIENDSIQIPVYVFNRNFLHRTLRVGEEVQVVGKYDYLKQRITCIEIIHNNLDQFNFFKPVYHSTDGLSSKVIAKHINAALDQFLSEVDENIPTDLISKYHLCSKKEMYKLVHKAKDLESATTGIRRAKYEELLIFMIKVNALKSELVIDDERYKKQFENEMIEDFIANLPFILTQSQVDVINDIISDMNSYTRMNRLVQGDVGSGKTVVAVATILMSFLSGCQSVFMAPTEILAEQHFKSIQTFFEPYDISVELLTGSTKSKAEIYERIKERKIDVVVGTHAVFQEKVVYDNLGLVITDEQHRFGVKQRERLNSKNPFIDVLYLSATPIPRTLALTVFGDLSISELKTMPHGRKEIKTTLYNNQQITDVLTEIYSTVKRQEQVYVVAPLIEESEKVEGVDVNSLYEKLNLAFKGTVKMAILHGAMTSQEKSLIMKSYLAREIDLLISTTVIEVGVDNPNSTLMVIFDAYKFGLAQLHQLRGRVGRGELNSKCLLVSSKESERLDILTQTNDGFKLSEEDLKLRGPGDFFGNQQSGLLTFKMANLVTDENILKCAVVDAKELVESNFDNEREKYLKNIFDSVKLKGLN